MNGNLTQFDELIESDVLDALGESLSSKAIDDADGEIADIPDELASIVDENLEEEIIDDIGDIEILPMDEIELALEEQDEEQPINQTITGVDTSDLATLLGQLLNNKTIEITIKIKD